MRSWILLATASTALHTLTASAFAQAVFDTVLLTGQQVPSLAPGVTFTQLGTPSVSASGHISAWCVFAGPGVTFSNNIALLSNASGTIGLFARTGDPAPGTPAGVFFSNTSNHRFNDAGNISAYSGVSGPGITGSNDFGHWLQIGPSLQLLAREGDPAPGTSGAVFDLLNSQPAFNAAGQAAFTCSLTGSGVVFSTSRALYHGSPGSLSLLARGGMIAPGTASPFFGFSVPTLNSAGQAAFVGSLTGAGVTSLNDEGLWFGTPGSLTLIARGGDSAPGAAPATYDSFGFPWLTSGGIVHFWSTLAGSGVTAANNQAIWRGTVSSLSMVVRSGDAAPGVPLGGVFATLDPPVMSSTGSLAFLGTLSGTGVTAANDAGVWSDVSGSVALVARKGDIAPGTDANFEFFFRPQISADGLVIFNAYLSGPGVDSTNQFGLWALGTDGDMYLIVRTGTPIDVNNDPLVTDLRTPTTIDTIFGASNFGGWNSSLNDSGQIALRAQFSDGSYAIILAEPKYCDADFNSDGVLDFTDFDGYVDAFESGGGDFNGDGFIDFTDFDAFVAAFELGC